MIFDVVADLDGQLQVVAFDRADFRDDWFQRYRDLAGRCCFDSDQLDCHLCRRAECVERGSILKRHVAKNRGCAHPERIASKASMSPARAGGELSSAPTRRGFPDLDGVRQLLQLRRTCVAGDAPQEQADRATSHQIPRDGDGAQLQGPSAGKTHVVEPGEGQVFWNAFADLAAHVHHAHRDEVVATNHGIGIGMLGEKRSGAKGARCAGEFTPDVGFVDRCEVGFAQGVAEAVDTVDRHARAVGTAENCDLSSTGGGDVRCRLGGRRIIVDAHPVGGVVRHPTVELDERHFLAVELVEQRLVLGDQ
jgi:hypothetical protein